MEIKRMSEVADAVDAASWLTTVFNIPGPHMDDRTLESLGQYLKNEFKESPEDVRRYIRAGLNLCLRELQDPHSRWYDENSDEFSRAEELLLFANDDGGVVIDSNKGEVFSLVEAIPEDIDQYIRHTTKGVRKRCIQTIVGLLSSDAASRDFIEKKKDKYSVDFWKSRAHQPEYSVAFSGMAAFHGPNIFYEYVLGQDGELFETLLFELQMIVECSSNKVEWVRILERDSGTSDKKKSQVLEAIKEGLAHHDDPA